MSNLFNVNSGSIDNLVVSSSLQALEKIIIKDKNVEDLLGLEQYGSLYFDTSNNLDVDPGSKNFRIGASSWDQQSTGIITVSLTNIDATTQPTKQQKYLQLINTLSSTGVAGYQIALTSANDTATYKKFEITKVEKQLTYVKFYVQELASGWNPLRLDPAGLPNDGEEFIVSFEVPAKQVQRFEFTTNLGSNKNLAGYEATFIPNWTPPSWTNKMTVICVGAGGGGGGGANGHIIISNQHLATGGGGGAGGNIAVSVFERNQISDPITGEIYPCDIYVGIGGAPGKGGENQGAHLILEDAWYQFGAHSDNYTNQYCHQRWDKVYQIGSGKEVIYGNGQRYFELDPEFENNRTQGSKEGQIFRRDIAVGFKYGAQDANSINAVNTKKHGKNGESGGFSTFGIKKSTGESLPILDWLTGKNQDINTGLLATGGEGGRGGWVSEYNPFRDYSNAEDNELYNYPVCSTVDVKFTTHIHDNIARNEIKNSKEYIRGGKVSSGHTFGQTIYLGGPGGQGSVPNTPQGMLFKNFPAPADSDNKYQLPISFVEEGFIGDMYSLNKKHFTPMNNTAVAPLFPWGKTFDFNGVSIWPEKELPYNTSFDTPGYFGCPGGGGGAGTSFHNVFSYSGQINQNTNWERAFFPSWMYIDTVKVDGESGKYSDEYIVDCPVRYYPNPETQFTFGGANTVQTEIFGIPIWYGGQGGRFSALQSQYHFGKSFYDAYTGDRISIDDVSTREKARYGGAFFDIQPPTTGSGFGVGGGGGTGHHTMYGMTRTKDWYSHQIRENLKNFPNGTKWVEKLTYNVKGNTQFLNPAAQGSRGNDGIVVVICES